MTIGGVEFREAGPERGAGPAQAQGGCSPARDIPQEAILGLYRALGWASAERPEQLRNGLANSDALVTAWVGDRLVGLANAISDGHLVVCYPHVLVHPEFQRQGIGSELMRRLMKHYVAFHQQLVLADGRAIEFYRRCGFRRAGDTQAMWLFPGFLPDHRAGARPR